MPKLTGIIKQLEPVIAGGNAIHCFTLVKKPAKYMEDKDEMYAAIFIEKIWEYVGPSSFMPSPLAIQLALLKPGAKVEVTIESEQEVGTGPSADLANRLTVTWVEPLKEGVLGG